MNSNITLPRLSAVAAAVTLAACGGSGNSNSGPPAATAPPPPVDTTRNVTAIGPITGFGSIYVNGVRFDTAGAVYDVDDSSASDDSSLAVGMVVKVKGTVDDDGSSGTAESIFYDDDVEGVVSNLAIDGNDPDIKTFEIMGIDVRADRRSTNFDAEDDSDFDFDSLADGDQVEISGYFSDGVLVASYIELQIADDDDYEIDGVISDYNGSDRFLLNLENGEVLNVTLAPNAEIPDEGIVDGQYVEVEGNIPDPVNAPAEFLAVEVELEDDDFLDDDDDEDIEIKGALDYDDNAGTWSVLGIELAFDDDTDYEPESLRDRIEDLSAEGLVVEVDGEWTGGVLVVDDIELEDGDIELTGDVESKTGSGSDGSLTLSFGLAEGTVSVTIDGSTAFLDDDAVFGFNLDAINAGDKVEVDAKREPDGSLAALVVRSEDDDEYEIEGPVDAFEDLVSITVLGVTFGVDAATEFEGESPSVGVEASVEDDDGDGIADSVEVDDDED